MAMFFAWRRIAIADFSKHSLRMAQRATLSPMGRLV